MSTESLTLKWGTLKAWQLNPDGPAFQALQHYNEAGPSSMSAMMQRDNPEQKKAICEIIDALDNDRVFLDWDGEYITKEKAKEYVMEYGK